MQARYIIITALLVAAVVLVCGCSTVTPTATPATPTPGAGSQYPMTVHDNYDRTATLSKAPERIISLSPANTEILFALGLGSKIVGDTEFCDYPAEAKNITHVSGFNALSYEKISAANPDVIFAEDIVREEGVTRLRDMGFQVIELKNANTTMIKKNIELMGMVTGTQANATALINTMDAGLNNISSKTSGLNTSQKPNVLLLTGYYPESEIYPYGAGTYGDELLALTGGKNAAGDINSYNVISNEAIVKADPDYIIIPVDGSMGTEEGYNYFKNGTAPWMKDMKAVKNGNVIRVDGNLFLRPGPRTPEAGLALARVIHPELFQ